MPTTERARNGWDASDKTRRWRTHDRHQLEDERSALVGRNATTRTFELTPNASGLLNSRKNYFEPDAFRFCAPTYYIVPSLDPATSLSEKLGIGYFLSSVSQATFFFYTTSRCRWPLLERGSEFSSWFPVSDFRQGKRDLRGTVRE